MTTLFWLRRYLSTKHNHQPVRAIPAYTISLTILVKLTVSLFKPASPVALMLISHHFDALFAVPRFVHPCLLVCVCCQVYYEPMLKLDIMTESELGQIFGTLDSLIPLHEGTSLFFSSLFSAHILFILQCTHSKYSLSLEKNNARWCLCSCFLLHIILEMHCVAAMF